MKQYTEVCLRFTRVPKGVGLQNLKAYFSLCVSFSALLAVILEMGEMKGEDIVARKLGLNAYRLREKTQGAGELACKNLAKMLFKVRPKMKEFADVLTFEEATEAQDFTTDDLVKRRNPFIYFENNLYFNIGDLEKKKNIKIL